MSETKRFCPAPRDGGGFTRDEWRAYWDSLTEGEKESLRNKAAWEHMSLSAVAAEWGASEPGGAT